MEIVLVIAVVAAVIAISLYFLKKKSKRASNTSASEPPSPHSFSFVATDATKSFPAEDIAPGWRVKHPELGSSSCVIVGVVSFVEDGTYFWYELFIEQANGTLAWLSVEESEMKVDAWNYALWTEVGEHDYSKSRSQVTHNGVTYFEDESGDAQFTTRGTSNIGFDSGSVHYVDFASADKKRFFSIERYSPVGGKKAKPEASVGVEIDARFLEISPPGL